MVNTGPSLFNLLLIIYVIKLSVTIFVYYSKTYQSEHCIQYIESSDWSIFE
jgi:hypothetical protein